MSRSVNDTISLNSQDKILDGPGGGAWMTVTSLILKYMFSTTVEPPNQPASQPAHRVPGHARAERARGCLNIGWRGIEGMPRGREGRDHASGHFLTIQLTRSAPFLTYHRLHTSWPYAVNTSHNRARVGALLGSAAPTASGTFPPVCRSKGPWSDYPMRRGTRLLRLTCIWYLAMQGYLQ